MAEEESPSTEHCLNCGAELTGKYCSQCGQKNIPRRQTLSELSVNFLGSFFSFESKFFTTFRYLLINPGFLAKEYGAGRRERYFHPARAYVFCSFIFFLIVFWDNSSVVNSQVTIDDDEEKKPFAWNADSVDGYSYEPEFRTKEAYDSAQQALDPEKRDSAFERFFELRSIELNNKYKGGNRVDDAVLKTFINNFPKVFFLLLPVFAALLKLLYIRRDFYYSEHLAFATIYYNSFFLCASIGMLIGEIPWVGWMEYLVYLWIPICLFVAMRVYFRQGWFKTFVKYSLLLSLFLFAIGIGLLVNLFATIMVL